MANKRILYILPYIPESDAVIDFYISEIRCLKEIGLEIYLYLIPLDNRKKIEAYSFYQELLMIVDKTNIAIKYPSIYSKIIGALKYDLNKLQLRRRLDFDSLYRIIINRFKIKKFDYLLTHYIWIPNKTDLFSKISKKKILIIHDLESDFNDSLISLYDSVGVLSTAEYCRIKETYTGMLFHYPYILAKKNIKKCLTLVLKTFGFIGSSHTPNIMGAINIIAIANLLPKNKFYIAGSVCKKLQGLTIPKNVTLLGNIESLHHFYNQIDAVLIPLQEGSGISMKILEAFSFSKPVISSEIGARGLEIFPFIHYIPAENPIEFYEIIKNQNTIYDYIDLSSNAESFFNANHTIKNQMKILSNLFRVV
jgi:glycosyltransferase involved in cell wall biosynthesis